MLNVEQFGLEKQVVALVQKASSHFFSNLFLEFKMYSKGKQISCLLASEVSSCFSNIAKEIENQYLNDVRSENEGNYTQH